MEDPDNAEPVRVLIPSSPVGIGCLPEQIVKKRIQEGFVFNILLIGETGIGKSTLASSLFNIPLCPSTENHMNSSVNLKCQTYDLSEKDINLKLTLVETVGYGDQINRNDNVEPIVKYVESQFESYFNEELKIIRSLSQNQDTRIHACLYFLCPTGHNVKALDIFCLKQLHDKMNIIPIVAKSDCLSKDELERFKIALKTTLTNQGIKFYRFPTDDEKMADANAKSNDLIPFAIAASGEYVPVEGKLTRARIFPWGTMLVEDEEHSDFLALKHALIEANMEDMREKTHTEYYESYRSARLIQLGCSDSEDIPFTYHELFEKQRIKLQKEMLDEEKKLQEKFIEKIRAKDEELKVYEAQMYSKYNLLFEQMKLEEKDIHRQRNELEQKIDALKKRKEMKRKKR